MQDMLLGASTTAVIIKCTQQCLRRFSEVKYTYEVWKWLSVLVNEDAGSVLILLDYTLIQTGLYLPLP